MKEKRMTIFHKIILVIILLLIPVVILYSYSNFVSEKVIRTEISNSLISRLNFLENRLNTQVLHMSRNAIELSRDPSLSSINSLERFKSFFDIIQFKTELVARIAVQSNTIEWANEIVIYFPPSSQVLSPSAHIDYDESYISGRVHHGWRAWPTGGSGNSGQTYDFYYYSIEPFSGYANPKSADNIVEIRFSGSSIVKMLDEYKEVGTSDPFLYDSAGGSIIANTTADNVLAAQVIAALAKRDSRPPDSFQTEINGRTYLINIVDIFPLGWTLVDYVPMEQVLLPVQKTKTLFYVSIALILMMGILSAFLLYRNVQIPIRQLLRNLQKLKRGDFSGRIDVRKGGEFQFVLQRFNEMSAQIGDLIENVYQEQITSRNAQLKQLQSQINPHFLYNCLYFIVNMVRLEQNEAAEKMAINLGDYFKYTTRLENQDATLLEESELLTSYLEIQSLRMERIRFDIAIPEQMHTLEIPRLLLQPIVENAVIHGLEPKLEGGEIRITGSLDGSKATIVVEDTGVGVDDRELDMLNSRLTEQISNGYGSWNVHKRLLLKFDKDSGIRYERAESGGLRVILYWHAGGGDSVSTDDR